MGPMTGEMRTYRYAAYGSNLHPIRLSQRVPSASWLGAARVSGFDLRFHKKSIDGSGKADIVEAASEIHVAVYEIPLEEKPLLDKVEGLGIGYEETKIHVPDIGDCWTYIAAKSHIEPTLAPYSWYKELVLLGCAYNSFPEDYIQSIRRVVETRDRNEARHQENSLLVKAIRKGS